MLLVVENGLYPNCACSRINPQQIENNHHLANYVCLSDLRFVMMSLEFKKPMKIVSLLTCFKTWLMPKTLFNSEERSSTFFNA